MPPDPFPTAETASKQLHEQLAEHARVAGWLARLDNIRIDAPAGAADQVRADYMNRLATLVAAVVQRTSEIRAAMAAAAQRITDARDRIPVLRVRHAVGELDDAALTQHLSILKKEAAEAELERSSLAALLPEADAAIEKLRATGSGSAAVPPYRDGAPSTPRSAPPPPTAMDDAFGEWQSPNEPGASGGTEEDDLGFLDDLPLSQVTSTGLGSGTDEPISVPSTARPSEAPEGASLVCKMCSGTSAATAWYCEHCGAELG